MPVAFRIIYVDDDPQLLEIGRIFLEQNRDFSVETIDSASAAIELLRHEKYDVIVSDYQMPGMNGIEFLKYLRSAGITTPFIIFTGKGREEIVIQALNEGADFYLQKGGEPESQFAELTHKIRMAIQKRKAEEALLEKTSELDRFFNSNLDLMAIADTEGYFRRLNPEWERTLGYPLSELEGRRFLDLVHPEDQGPTLDYLSTLRSQEQVLNFSNRYRHKDGSYRWIEWRSYPYGEFIYASARDITERKQAEAALRESTERYRNVVEDQTEFISRFLPDGTHIFVNDAYCRYFGVTRSEILGHRFSPTIPPEDNERITQFFKALTPDNPVGSIEHRIIMPDGTIRWQRWSDRAIFDPSGKIIEYQSVGRDVTEIKRTEEALRKSETKYRSLFDNAVLGIFLSTPEGRYIDINAAFARIAGYDNPEEMKSVISDIQKQLYVHPEDRKTINTLLSTVGEIKNFEAEIRHRDGHSIWISINAKAVRDRDGKILAYEGTIEEITARKIAERDLNRKNEELVAANEQLAASEEELRHQLDEIRSRDLMLAKSEESFRVQYQNNPIAIFTWRKKDDDFVLVDFNKAADTLTKGRVKDYIGKFASDLYLSRPEIISEVRQCFLEQSTISKELISEHFLPGRYVKTTATFAPPDMILVHLEDITDSKWGEEAIRESEEKYRTLHENAGIGIGYYTPDGIVISYNLVAAAHMGGRPQDFAGKSVFDLFPKEDADRYYDRILKAAGSEESVVYEDMVPLPQGNIFFLSTFSRITGSGGDVVGIQIISQEITRLKNAEEALRSERERLAGILQGTNAGTWEWNVQTGETVFNERWAEIIGYTLEELSPVSIETWRRFCHPDDLNVSGELLDRHFRGELDYYECETRMRHKNGEWIWVMDRGRVITWNHDGKPFVMMGTHQDISDWKRAEEALKQSTDRLSLATRAGGVGIWDYDIVNNTLKWDNQMFALYGITKEQFGGAYEAWQAGLLPEDKQRCNDEVQMAIRGEKEFDTEFHVLWPDGSTRTIRAFALVQRDAGGKPLRMIGTNWDITDLKRAEEEVRQTRRNYEAFFNTIDDFLYVLDEQGRILNVNETVIRRLRYTREELLGQPVLMVHPPERRDDAERTVQGMLAGTIDFCPVPVMTRDGHLIPVETRVISGEWDGRPVLFGVSKDISDLIVSEEKFSAAFHSNAAAMAVSTKHDGKFVDVNAAFLQMLGFSREEVIGKSVGDLHLFTQPEDRINAIRLLEEGGMVRNLEVRVLTKDGSALYGLFSADSIIIGDIPYLLTTMVDITERKNLEYEMKFHEYELMQFSKTLATANRKLTLLSSITRHDINNQLTVLMGFLSILEKKQSSPTQTDYFQKISTAAQRISAMIQFTKEYEEIGLTAPIWQDCHILADDAAKHATLGKVIVKNDIPAGMEVFADPLIAKVFYNLMDNAVRYGGKITTIGFSVKECDGDYVIVCEDDGDGIPADEKEKIFERGFGRNTGLGLFLAREILAITGITIAETVEPGKGARFEMAVPKSAWRGILKPENRQ